MSPTTDLPVRVSISTPVPALRIGLTQMLSSSGDRFRVTDDLPDVVVWDSAHLLDEGTVPDLVTHVRHPGRRVLVLRHELRPGLATRALDLGADAHVSDDVDAEALVDLVASLALGALDDDSPHTELVDLGRRVGLSEREYDILKLICQGYDNREIADTMFLSINTVKTYIRTGYRKIGLRTRTQAVAWALSNGLETSSDLAAHRPLAPDRG